MLFRPGAKVAMLNQGELWLPSSTRRWNDVRRIVALRFGLYRRIWSRKRLYQRIIDRNYVFSNAVQRLRVRSRAKQNLRAGRTDKMLGALSWIGRIKRKDYTALVL